MISSFQVFDLFQVMTNGGPDDQTRALSLDVYESAFRYQRMGWAAAVSVVLFLHRVHDLARAVAVPQAELGVLSGDDDRATEGVRAAPARRHGRRSCPVERRHGLSRVALYALLSILGGDRGAAVRLDDPRHRSRPVRSCGRSRRRSGRTIRPSANYDTILSDPDLPLALFYRNSLFVAVIGRDRDVVHELAARLRLREVRVPRPAAALLVRARDDDDPGAGHDDPRLPDPGAARSAEQSVGAGAAVVHRRLRRSS